MTQELRKGYWDFITNYSIPSFKEGSRDYLRLDIYFNMLDDNLKEQEEYDTEDLKNLKVGVTKVGYKEIEGYDA